MATGALSTHARVLTAVGVTSLALIAVSPADAVYRGYTPSDVAMTAAQSSAGSGADWMDMSELKVYGAPVP